MSTNTITHINVAARDLDEHIGERFQFGEGEGVLLSVSVDAQDSVEVSFMDEEGDCDEEWTAFAGEDEVTVFCDRKLIKSDESTEIGTGQTVLAFDLPDHIGKRFFFDDGNRTCSGTLTSAECWLYTDEGRYVCLHFIDSDRDGARARIPEDQEVCVFDTEAA